MEVLDRIIAIIRNNIITDVVITAETNLRKDLAIDSLDVLMIMNEIDDVFSIALDEDDFRKVNSPGEIVDLLKDSYGITDV